MPNSASRSNSFRVQRRVRTGNVAIGFGASDSLGSSQRPLIETSARPSHRRLVPGLDQELLGAPRIVGMRAMGSVNSMHGRISRKYGRISRNSRKVSKTSREASRIESPSRTSFRLRQRKGKHLGEAHYG